MAYDDTLRDKNEVIRAYEVCFIVIMVLIVFALVIATTLTSFSLYRIAGVVISCLRSVNCIERRA